MSASAADISGLARTTMEFTSKMFAKQVSKAESGWFGWNDKEFMTTIEGKMMAHCQRLLEGDARQAVDVANLAMFIWNLKGRP